MKWMFVAALAISAQFCAGQSTISTTHRRIYAANAGWIDFRPSAEDGVIVSESFLSGKTYGANFGWISVGDGSPDNGHSYSNTSAGDFGVNLDPDGGLTGRAYSANCGWITFEQTYGMPRLDLATGKFSGLAYGANIGWIHLDPPGSDLVTAVIVRPDTDGDGIPDAWEMLHFEGSLLVADDTSDADGDAVPDIEEYLAGTNPKDPASFFRVLSHSTPPSLTSTTLTFSSNPSRLYRLEHNEELDGLWTDSGFGVFAPDPGVSTSKTTPHFPSSRRFFRVSAVLPLNP